jgi:hypothetical protein
LFVVGVCLTSADVEHFLFVVCESVCKLVWWTSRLLQHSFTFDYRVVHCISDTFCHRHNCKILIWNIFWHLHRIGTDVKFILHRLLNNQANPIKTETNIFPAITKNQERIGITWKSIETSRAVEEERWATIIVSWHDIQVVI